VSREAPRRVHVVGAAIVEGGRVFLARRGPDRSMPGKWEFPGGKVEAGEAPEAALVREVAEELDVEIELGRFLGRGEADHDGRTIVLDVWLARRVAGDPVSREHDAVGWFAAGELAALDWPEADLPLLGPLARALGAGEFAREQSESAAGE